MSEWRRDVWRSLYQVATGWRQEWIAFPCSGGPRSLKREVFFLMFHQNLSCFKAEICMCSFVCVFVAIVFMFVCLFVCVCVCVCVNRGLCFLLPSPSQKFK